MGSVVHFWIQWPRRLRKAGAYSLALASLFLVSACGGGGGGASNGSASLSADPSLAAQISDIKPDDATSKVAVFVELRAPGLVAAAATRPATRQQLQDQFLADLKNLSTQAASGVAVSSSCDLSALGSRINSAFKPSSGSAVRIELSRCELDLLPRIANVRGVHVDIPLSLNASVADTLALEVRRSFGGSQAWPVLNGNAADGNGRIVAVIDTGVESRHPALAGKVLQGACFSSNSAVSSSLCPNGQDVDTLSLAAGSSCGGSEGSSSALAGDRVKAIRVGCGHGTGMAGVAAMDYSGTSGVASDGGMARRAKILPIQAFRLDTGSDVARINSSSSDLLAALEWLAQQADTDAYRGKIAAVNLSLGGGSYSSACDGDYIPSLFKTAFENLRAKGILPVVAAGNEGNRSAVSFPACVSNAVAVAASRLNNVGLAGYSNFSAQVKVIAPGGDFDGSGRYAVPSLCADTGSFDCWQIVAGTSPATAFVTGTVATLRSVAPGKGLAAVEAALTSDLGNSLPTLAKTLTELLSSLTRPALQALASAYSLLGLSEPSPASSGPPYAVGGAVAGLANGQSLTLTNFYGDGATTQTEALLVNSSGTFAFGTRLASGAKYYVGVTNQPIGQTCIVTAGSDTVASANVNSVSIKCVNNSDLPALKPGCSYFLGTLSCTAELPAQQPQDNSESSINPVGSGPAAGQPSASNNNNPNGVAANSSGKPTTSASQSACTLFNGQALCAAELPAQGQQSYQMCVYSGPNYQNEAACFLWNGVDSPAYGFYGTIRSVRVRTINAAIGPASVGNDITAPGVFKLTLTPLSSKTSVVLASSTSDLSAMLPKNAKVRLFKIERP